MHAGPSQASTFSPGNEGGVSGASPDEIAAKIGLVVEVFEEQGIPLDDLLCDSYGEELEPEAQLEASQLLHYGVGAAYRWHYDAYDQRTARGRANTRANTTHVRWQHATTGKTP